MPYLSGLPKRKLHPYGRVLGIKDKTTEQVSVSSLPSIPPTPSLGFLRHGTNDKNSRKGVCAILGENK
jgi:hypothetical protein